MMWWLLFLFMTSFIVSWKMYRVEIRRLVNNKKPFLNPRHWVAIWIMSLGFIIMTMISICAK